MIYFEELEDLKGNPTQGKRPGDLGFVIEGRELTGKGILPVISGFFLKKVVIIIINKTK